MLAIGRITLFVAFALLAGCSGESVRLQWQYDAGDELRYRVTNEQSVEMSTMKGQTMTTSMSMVMHQEVKEVAEDGTATIEVRYDAMRTEMDMGMRMSFDSTLAGEAAKQNDLQLSEMFQAMRAARIRTKIAPSGRVIEISGTKELIESALETLGPKGPGQMLESLFSDDSMRRMVEFNVFPDKTLVPGDTWVHDSEFDLQPMGKAKVSQHSDYEGLEEHAGRKCVTIAMKLDMSLESDPKSEMAVKLESSNGKGTMWFDNEDGRMIEFKYVMDMDMTMSSNDPDKDREPTRSKMQLSSRMLLLDKNAPAFEPASSKAGAEKK